MNILKKILCALLCVVLLLNFAACSDNGDGGKKPSGSSGNTSDSMIEGDPSTLKKDAFVLPSGDFGASGAPVLTQAIRTVEVGDSIVVTGMGLSQKGIKAYVYAQDSASGGKSYECKYKTVNDNEIAIVTDENMKYGVFAVYVTTDKGNSNIMLINDPQIYWIGTTEVTKDDTISIYGENLTYDDCEETKVFFSKDGKYCTPEIIEKNPYKVTVKIPETLEENAEYEVSLYSGFGGEYGYVKAEEKIKFVKKKVNDFSSGKTINVTDYGANPADDGADDKEGILAAVNSASDGDTIYFPNGTYVIDSVVTTSTSLRFKGESKKGVKIISGKSGPEKLFDVSSFYAEFCDLSFYEIREDSKLMTTFINYKGSGELVEFCEINVHDCYFEQEAPHELKPIKNAVAFIASSNARYENNETMETITLWANGTKKLFYRNNSVCGNVWASPEFNQNSTLFWNTNMCDVSGNKMYSRDSLDDKTHILGKDDKTTGRSIVFQGYMKNSYIGDNELIETGVPNTNAGEQILMETGSMLDFEVPVSATANTVTFNEDFMFISEGSWRHRLAVGDIVAVLHGDGAGQYRKITKIDGKTLTVDKDWAVVPTKNSIVGVSVGGQNIVIYNNDVSGYKNFAEESGATCGVSTSGPTFNLNIIDNKFSDMPVGIFMSHKYKTTTGNMPITMVQYFSNVSGNLVENTCKAIRYELYYTIPQPNMQGEEIYLNIGSSFRRNTIKNTVDYTDYRKGLGGMAVNLGTQPHLLGNQATPTWVGDWLYGILFENNSFENSVDNIRLCKHQGNTILRNNKVDKGELFKVDPNGGQPIMFND